jgi:hypothetical protein
MRPKSHLNTTITLLSAPNQKCLVMFQKILLIAFFSISVLSISAAQDTAKIPVFCSDSTLEYSNRIAAIGWPITSESLDYLRRWEAYCDYSEPAERLRILVAIDAGIYTDNMFLDYLGEGIRRYQSRCVEAESPDFRAFYADHAAWFSYLPLNSSYDLFTKEYAEKLLPGQKEKTGTRLLCLLLSGNMAQFEKERMKKPFRFTPYHRTLRVKTEKRSILDKNAVSALQTSVIMPFGDAAHVGNPGFQVGWNGKLRAGEHYLFGPYVNFDIYTQPDSFSVRSDVTGQTKTVSSGNMTLGVNVVRRTAIFQNTFWYQVGGGLGYTSLFTNADQFSNPDNDNNTQKLSVTGFEVKSDFEIGKITRRGNGLALAANYHFRPYGFDRKLLSPMSWSNAVIGIRWYW